MQLPDGADHARRVIPPAPAPQSNDKAGAGSAVPRASAKETATRASKCRLDGHRQMQNSRSRAEGVFTYAESKRTRIEKQKYKSNGENRPVGRFSTLIAFYCVGFSSVA